MIRSDIGFPAIESAHHSFHLLIVDALPPALGVTTNKAAVLLYGNNAMQNELTVITSEEYDVMFTQSSCRFYQIHRILAAAKQWPHTIAVRGHEQAAFFLYYLFDTACLHDYSIACRR